MTHYQRAMKINIDQSMAALIDRCADATNGGGCGTGDVNCSCNQKIPYTMGDLQGLKTQVDGLFDFDAHGQINEYNMMYMLRQINSLFKYTFFDGDFAKYEGVSEQTIP